MAGAATTDVRAWLREQGDDVKERGAIPADLREKYERAHQGGPSTVPGEVVHSQLDLGVTEADFPPAPDDGSGFDDPGPGSDAPKTSRNRERRPRNVKPPKGGGLRERIWGGRPAAGSSAKKKPPPGPRVSLSDWAEETWSDLAWLAQPIPPLARMLTMQAPYAGVVADEQIAGTFVDGPIQAAARYSKGFRALNGLAGPPVYVGLICATGKRVQPVDPETGRPAVYPDGSAVMVYDQRTQMLFQGLRYSLLQMTKISAQNAEQIQERVQVSAERMRVVDAMIESLFDMSPTASPPPAAPQAPPQGTGGGEPHPNGYRYPDPPSMDSTGADPGRL
jgi:hypothetical protein